MDYEKLLNEKRAEIDKLESVVNILEKIKKDMEWDCMKYIEDDSEEGHHFEVPNEEDWCYSKYVAYSEVVSLIEKKYFK